MQATLAKLESLHPSAKIHSATRDKKFKSTHLKIEFINQS